MPVINSVTAKTLASTISGNILGTGFYFNQIISGAVALPQYLYDNVLTNPIFYGLLIVILLLSLVTFSD